MSRQTCWRNDQATFEVAGLAGDIQERLDKLGISLPTGDLLEDLKDGSLLFELLKRFTDKNIKESQVPLVKLDLFIMKCAQMGIRRSEMCSAADLAEGKKEREILRTVLKFLERISEASQEFQQTQWVQSDRSESQKSQSTATTSQSISTHQNTSSSENISTSQTVATHQSTVAHVHFAAQNTASQDITLSQASSEMAKNKNSEVTSHSLTVNQSHGIVVNTAAREVTSLSSRPVWPAPVIPSPVYAVDFSDYQEFMATTLEQAYHEIARRNNERRSYLVSDLTVAKRQVEEALERVSRIESSLREETEIEESWKEGYEGRSPEIMGYLSSIVEQLRSGNPNVVCRQRIRLREVLTCNAL